MLYCNKCEKEVVSYGASPAPGIEDALEEIRAQAEAEEAEFAELYAS